MIVYCLPLRDWWIGFKLNDDPVDNWYWVVGFVWLEIVKVRR